MLCEGDLVLIRRQDTVDSGRYAVALVDGEEGLVKQVFHGPGWLELRSVNPYYPPRRFEGEALERVRLLGRWRKAAAVTCNRPGNMAGYTEKARRQAASRVFSAVTGSATCFPSLFFLYQY